LAISDTLQARFSPVRVRGEISSFAKAASGHCYFTLKDTQGQLRCAMFKRAASLNNFVIEDGLQVEVSGRLGVYEQRGDLQLVVESITRMGQGTLMEEFVRLKTKLEAAGLFEPARKRPLVEYPRGIGVVTSQGAAAWHDCLTALARRVPNIPVLLSPALVQGNAAPTELIAALHRLYELIDDGHILIDVILLVRGGGSMEDLWAFNDERLAYTMAQSPVPIVCGVGHETDFSIADFVADMRAPTPTAAAELCALPAWQAASQLAYQAKQLQSVVQRELERRAQSLDHAGRRLLAPSDVIRQQRIDLVHCASRVRQALVQRLQMAVHQLAQTESKLQLMHPQKVLDRGFAWVSDADGGVVIDPSDVHQHQLLNVYLARGLRQALAV
jgi:exodeoxyribonuclease VII large subunit